MSRELLFRLTRKDFEVTWFRGSGGGGQHRNKHANCCHIRHPASGAVSTGQSSRSRVSNQKEAFRGLLKKPDFMRWYRRRIAEITEKKTLEQMSTENLLIEVRTEHGWIEIE